jgi:hypothetical protein
MGVGWMASIVRRGWKVDLMVGIGNWIHHCPMKNACHPYMSDYKRDIF